MRTTRILLSLLLFGGFALHAQAPEDARQADRPMDDADLATCLREFNQTPLDFAPSMLSEIQTKGTGLFQESGLPLGASDVAPHVTTAVSLVTGEKDGRGVATYSRNQQTSDGKINDLSVSVSVPFNKSEGQAVFASLNGLSGDVVASLAFSRFLWDLEPQDYGAALCRECQAQRLSLQDCFPETLESALRQKGSTEEEIEDAIGSLGDKLFGAATAWFWGLEGTVGRRERSFFEPVGTKSKEDRLGGTVALNLGWLLESGHLYLRATGKRDFKDRAAATLCTPITGSVLDSCSSLPLGEAQEVDSLVAAAEYRRFFPRLAISPSAQYDIKESVLGLQLPIFLTTDGKGKFTGGVKLGWRSDERDLITTVFVSRGLE